MQNKKIKNPEPREDDVALKKAIEGSSEGSGEGAERGDENAA